MLQNRRQQVTLVTQENSNVINLTNEQLDAGEEIEMYIVKDVVGKHETFTHDFNKSS